MENKDPSITFSELARAAESPEGKKLLALFQSNQSPEFCTAMEKASHGNFADAQKIISSILASSEATDLAERLEKNYGRDK